MPFLSVGASCWKDDDASRSCHPRIEVAARASLCSPAMSLWRWWAGIPPLLKTKPGSVCSAFRSHEWYHEQSAAVSDSVT